jgi:hypothetical protein
VLVKPQLLQHTIKAGVWSVGHGDDCNGYTNNCRACVLRLRAA